MYLFDTDTVSSLFKPNPSGRLLVKLTLVPREQKHISSITVYEIVYGAYRSDRKAPAGRWHWPICRSHP